MLMRIGSLVFALPGIVLLVFYGIELSAITDCQQAGLFYQIESGDCVSESQPLSSFYARNTLLVNLALLIATLGAFAMIAGMLQRGMTRGH